ncbi:hypothetical protein F5887DRAFT_299021 [Amanita rubescens]|nr:hypothetical protein F5887DRAFT_299021 [Amanita rubescens]
MTSPCYGGRDLHTLTVSLFAGNVVNLYLYGALTVQLYLYYTFFPKDSKLFKGVIYALFIIETIHTILLICDLGLLLFGRITFPQTSHVVVPVCGGTAAFLTQAMYAYRIHIITQQKYVPSFIITATMLQLVAIIVLTALGIHFSDILIVVWVFTSLVVDMIVAGTMVWFLKREKIYSKLLRWRITRLVYIVIGTGILTVAVNAFTALSYLISPYVPCGPIIVLSKLYSNSMMVLVNDRISSSEDSRHATPNATTTRFSKFHWEMAGPLQENLAADGSRNDGCMMTA